MSRALVLLALPALALWVGCGGQPAARDPYSKLSEAVSGDLTVELWTDRPLAVGVNRLQYRVLQGGQAQTSATLAQKPLMNMVSTGSSHGAPVVDPLDTANDTGRFEGTVVFVMASSGSDAWDLTLDVTLPQGATASPKWTALAVAERDVKRTLTAGSGTMTEKLTLTLDLPAPVMGINDYRLTAHKMDMMTHGFKPVADLSFHVTPQMTSMGHGSSGNLDPTGGADGFYAGQLNFSMSGEWDLKVDVSRGATALGSVDYSVSF